MQIELGNIRGDYSIPGGAVFLVRDAQQLGSIAAGLAVHGLERSAGQVAKEAAHGVFIAVPGLREA